MRGWSAARYRSQLVAPCFLLCSAAFLKPSPGFLKLEHAGESPGGLVKAQMAALLSPETASVCLLWGSSNKFPGQVSDDRLRTLSYPSGIPAPAVVLVASHRAPS